MRIGGHPEAIAAAAAESKRSRCTPLHGAGLHERGDAPDLARGSFASSGNELELWRSAVEKLHVGDYRCRLSETGRSPPISRRNSARSNSSATS